MLRGLATFDSCGWSSAGYQDWQHKRSSMVLGSVDGFGEDEAAKFGFVLREAATIHVLCLKAAVAASVRSRPTLHDKLDHAVLVQDVFIVCIACGCGCIHST